MSDPHKFQNKWLVFSLAALGVFMSTLDGSIVNVALPTIMADLQVSLVTIEWVMVIYLLTVSSTLLLFGRLSDIRGRRWVYCRGFAVFTAGSFLCALSPGAGWLIASRALQGLGAAMLMACSPALVVDAFPENERGKALGLIGTVVASGLTLGPAIGGILLDDFAWPAIFYINLPIGILATLLAKDFLKGTRADITREDPLDLKGAALLLICFVAVLTGVIHVQQWGVYLLVLGVVAVLAAIGLVKVERRCQYPIFPIHIFQKRLFTLPLIAAVIMFASLFTVIFLMPFFLFHPCGLGPQQVGYMMVTPFIFLFIISPISGAVSDRIGSRWLCTLGMGILAAAIFALMRLAPETALFDIAWRLALAGSGVALFLPPNSAVAMNAVAPQYRGTASGTVATARNMGMVLGVALAGLIFNLTFRRLTGLEGLTVYRAELQADFMTAFRYAMAAGGILAVVGMAVAYLRGPDRAGN